MIAIPQNVLDILRALNERGHEAYVVGGCVRDSLLGRTPIDWDVTTSALPEETAGIFDALGGYTVAKTGLAHGTLTIIKEHCPVEITTYRVDGAYSDARHPDAVRFTRSLREDLSRRDFTINAMAYHPDVGLVDYFRAGGFGGPADLLCGRSGQAVRRGCAAHSTGAAFRLRSGILLGKDDRGKPSQAGVPAAPDSGGTNRG